MAGHAHGVEQQLRQLYAARFPGLYTWVLARNGHVFGPRATVGRAVEDIAQAVRAVLEMNDRGFTPELTVFATNPLD